MAKKKEQIDGKKVKKSPRITNRRGKYEYHISEVVECGMELVGTEVKSLRAGQGKIDEAYALINKKGEAFLIGANIAPYPLASDGMQHDPTRRRKLLLHHRQIHQLEVHLNQKGKTLIPLAIFFKGGWAKCELGVAEGKKKYDKRDAIKKRQQQRDIAREMRRR